MTLATTKPALELPNKQPMQYRCAALDITPLVVRAEDGTETVDENAFNVVISSDTPIDRGGYFEVLGHKPSEVDLSFAKNGLTLQLEHGGPHRSYSPDPSFHLGDVTEIKLRSGEGKLGGVARFAVDEACSPQALLVKRDWQSKRPTRRFISVGMVQQFRSVTEAARAGESTIVRWTRWQPREVSVVAAPADPNASRERSAGLEEFEVTDDPATTQHRHEETTTMTPDAPTGTPAPAAAPSTPAGATVGEDRFKARSAEVKQIVALCVAQNCVERSSEFIDADMTIAQVKTKLFDEMAARSRETQTRQPSSESLEGLTGKDRRRYSYRKAAVLSMQRRNADIDSVRGVEGDVHRHLAKLRPIQAGSNGGILVPFDLRSEEEIVEAWERKMEHRTMQSNVAGKGLEWVGEQQMPFVDMLVAQTALPRLGANFNTGLTGNLSYPRETGQPTVVFQGENPGTGVTKTDATSGEILSGPKQMIGATEMSRQWLFQTAGAGEARVRRALVDGTSRALDRNGFHGNGTGSLPTGVYFVPGVGTVAMGAVTPTWPKITDMGGKISDQNGDIGRMGFVTTALMAWRLMATLMASASGSQFIWSGAAAEGLIAGYRAIGSTQISKALGAGADEHGFIFGNWAFCDVNLWGATELVVDEVTQGDKALVVVRSYGLGDIVITHPEAFCVATGAKPA